MNMIKSLVKNEPQGFVKDFDQIIQICEYEMISTTIMKKQYQNIFNINEIEKQKCKRFKCQIGQKVEGLTSEKVQSLLVDSIKSTESVEQGVAVRGRLAVAPGDVTAARDRSIQIGSISLVPKGCSGGFFRGRPRKHRRGGRSGGRW
ncbi:hypothetical protein PAAG_08832 [Paracoccidioides lutzii Pb01]|uniref:Uncharacterized protein n=1 Tax=Paracoccidioides lutzii (strain ATCC MYA-826 / Pb01) TaxID=502779 RepID=C1HDJ1_PARBA|nr:hypothetical protein PAAG_08832 [Paracoccidioides lutzii Pb01]EEH39563.2 hypothetical protein PAAG_08832 [Paracoccidioides lutzii Pb01]